MVALNPSETGSTVVLTSTLNKKGEKLIVAANDFPIHSPSTTYWDLIKKNRARKHITWEMHYFNVCLYSGRGRK